MMHDDDAMIHAEIEFEKAAWRETENVSGYLSEV
jgi:hypothetical protein